MQRPDDEPLQRGDEVQYLVYHLLRRLGFQAVISTELDEFHATDILVSGHRRRKRDPRMAVQTTTARRSAGKASRFTRWAGRKFRGPLLFLRCRGPVTLPMAEALRDAIFELWDDPDWKARRARGLRVYSDGNRRWFSVPQP